MMRTVALLALLLALPSGNFLAGEQGHSSSGRKLSAPTYYLAVTVGGCDSPTGARVRGASNLPPGAIVTLQMVGFHDAGWNSYSDEVYVPVDHSGFFSATVYPKKGITFPLNAVLWASFLPFRPEQPTSVLNTVGNHGQKLGGFDNPQVEHVSGYWELSTVARAYCQ
jgi:hypothetical protein